MKVSESASAHLRLAGRIAAPWLAVVILSWALWPLLEKPLSAMTGWVRSKFVQVPVSLPNVTGASGSNVTIPITVGNLTGGGVFSYDFDLLFDQNVLQLQNPAFDASGTLSSGLTVTPNATPGRLRISAFSVNALTGAGTLLNLKFTVVGAAGTSTALTWQSFIFNEDTQTNLTNGSFTVPGACVPPGITTPPSAQTVCAGGSATFSVIATGTGIGYQWRKNEVAIGGATSSSFAIPVTVTGDAGNYDVVITGACGNITSTAVPLTVNSAVAVSGINPTSGAAGSTVTINGSGFTGVTAVKFSNNVAAVFNVANDTAITATVPTGAVTGPITISKTTCADVQTPVFTVGGPACIPVSISTALTGAPGSSLTVPITVPNLTGQGVVSYDFTVMFDTSVLTLQTPAIDAAGTLSSGLTVTPNTSVPGKITVSAFGISPLSGSGTLLNLRFNVVGAAGACTDLTWMSFNFNEGTPCATTGNGRFCVQGGNAQPTISAVGATQQQGSPVANSTIANISDANQAANTLTVAVNGGATATVNGVTVSGISVSAGGAVTANVIATCTATTANFTLRVTDSGGLFAEATLTATVTNNTAPVLTYGNQSVAAGGSLNFNPASGPSDNGTVSSIVVQSQGTYTGTISVNNSTGVISLSNAKPGGTHTITIRATDNCGAVTDAAFNLTVTCPTITVNPANPTLPPGTVGQNYSQTFTATGGAIPYGFTVSAGTLSPGLNLSTGGLLSGTPTGFGSFSFTIRATDTNGCTGERQYTLSVCPIITINPPSLPAGTVGTAYNQSLNASGGASPYTFTVTAGALPGGLSISSGGLLSGTPTTAATVTFTIRATDANACLGERQYSLTINSVGNGLQFYPLPTPVRLLDTRSGVAGCVTGVGAIPAGSTRTQPARTACSTIPANATAIIGNITVVPSGSGFLTLFPSDATQPTVANSNFTAGEVTNNFFTVGLGAADGAFKIFSNASTDVIIDLTGYYAPPGAGGLYYHPLPSPVRLVQTFPGQTGCFASPTVTQLQGTNDPNANPALDLMVQGRGGTLPSPCNAIPDDAVVLVGNATTVFPSAPFGFGYLTIYPSDATRPTVASSNYGNNGIVNGPFAVKLGADGRFKVYTFSTTHLVIDISGYYSASSNDANGAGLLFNPLPKPMRLLETRNISGFPLTGCYQPKAPIPGGTGGIRTQQAWGQCSDQPPLTIPTVARALVGNVTAINPAGAGFGTFFPGDVGTAPTVATTNYPFPVVFGYNRHYYVGLSPADGTFKILTQFTSDYIVDVSGYFAP